jgi:YHS domain-containing protein
MFANNIQTEIMKKMTRYTLILACAAGVLAVTPKAAAANSGACPAMQSGCCAAEPMADKAGTNAVPDLLTTCPVSGEKLGEMGDAYVFTYKGQEVKLCCKDCKKKFDKDPEKYMKLIRAADKKTESK